MSKTYHFNSRHTTPRKERILPRDLARAARTTQKLATFVLAHKPAKNTPATAYKRAQRVMREG